MRYSIILILIAVLPLIITGCHPRHDPRLAEADRLMEESPDSSLILLQDIDPGTLKKADRALYGLLITEALDKNHLDLSDEELITQSVDYYSTNQDSGLYPTALYYLGRARYLNGKVPEALLSFHKARMEALREGDKFIAGMACRGISDIYNSTYNHAEEEAYARQEYAYIIASGRQPYADYSLLDLGRALCSGQKNEEVEQIVSQLEDSARLHEDPYLRVAAIRLIGLSRMSEGRHVEARKVYEDICSGPFAEAEDSLRLSMLCSHTGDIAMASSLLNQTTGVDSILRMAAEYRLLKALGRNDEALYLLERIDSLGNNCFYDGVSHNLGSIVTDFFELQGQKDAAEVKSARLLNWLIATIALLLVSGCGVVYFFIRGKHKRELEKKIMIVEELTEAMKRIEDADTRKTVTVRALIAEKYGLLEDLSIFVIEGNNDKKIKDKVLAGVSRLIGNMSMQGNGAEEMECQVNDIYDNLMHDLRTDLPDMKEVDYRLYLFSIMGFSSTTISHFIGEKKVESVYNRKRRLKDKIRTLDEDRQKRYFSYL